MFPFLQSPATSPDSHDFSNTMERSLADASATTAHILQVTLISLFLKTKLRDSSFHPKICLESNFLGLFLM